MAKYKLEILPSVIRKDLAKLPKSDVQKIMQRIGGLADNPRPIWAKKLSGREEYRARQGNYRILYVIQDTVRVVQVTKVGHRRHIYD
jgi:mRNA interferase RelE/StbE